MYAEKLMQNKKGGIVAIEPSTGEILAKVSVPCYDPNLLVGNKRSHNYGILQKDTLKPLFDRAMMATYPPGSVFKLIQALIALEEGTINENTRFPCHNGYSVGNFHMGCHHHESPLDLKHSIQQSCNAYFASTYRSILEQQKYNSVRNAYIQWRKYITSFGFGDILGVDIPYEKKGFIPTAEYWDSRYRTKNWRALNIISLAIGQGDILITPLQMANMVCAIANRGEYITPHIVKEVSDYSLDKSLIEKHTINIDKKHFESVIDGMEMVTSGPGATGTLAKVDSISVCGKTGTVQNPHGADHSVFVAFAPKINPKIAIVVYVENGVWGARYGAPIAGLIIEKYLKGEISKNKKFIEERMLNANIISNETAE